MQGVSAEAIAHIEDSLRARLSGIDSDAQRSVSGVQALVDILNAGERSLERIVLEKLGEQDAQLAEEIKKKLFVFEDILQLEDRAVQIVAESVKEKIFANMSERASSTLKEDMEMSGPVRLRDVEAAQQRIALSIRALEERGEITIARGDESPEDELV